MATRPPDRARIAAEKERILYGRRSGRRLRAGQRRLLETLFPEIQLALPEQEAVLDLARLFGPDKREFWLEVGFGAGEHLIEQSRANPQAGIIGCEPYLTGVVQLLGAIRDAGVDNIRLLRDDARALLGHLPEAGLSRIFVLFPDPWPKTRHHKRRFLARPVFDQLARSLRDGGELRIATDHAGYLEWILEHIRASGQFDWKARSPDDWRNRPGGWPETRYGVKAAAAGRACVYLRYIRRPRS